ncbi:hypothetical protein [Nocardia sp. NPDC056000]|uniref:hypothetical protein n=1 Tax=Nocardia sp. NPDC056000 TaxID=3345674 RepID=UPI0035E0014D
MAHGTGTPAGSGSGSSGSGGGWSSGHRWTIIGVGVGIVGVIVAVIAIWVQHRDSKAAEIASTGKDQYPNTCIVVQNHSGTSLKIRTNYPPGHGVWTYQAEDWGLLLDGDHQPLKSDGFQLNIDPPTSFSWWYDVSGNRDQGCNGSWILTLNPP